MSMAYYQLPSWWQIRKQTIIRRTLDTADPPILLAILIAARRTGDRLLETVARRELDVRHKIKIRFGVDLEEAPGCPLPRHSGRGRSR